MKDLTKLFNQPSDIRAYISQRANNYDLDPQALFDKIPNHLKDNPSEIMDFLSTSFKHGDSIGMEVSHIISQKNAPHLVNDPNNIILETTQGNPNQVRGANNMDHFEVDQVLKETQERALYIENKYTNDNSNLLNHQSNSHSINNYTPDSEIVKNVAFNSNNDVLSDAIHNALNNIAHTAGIALTYAVIRVYTPKIIALIKFIAKYRRELIKSSEWRKRLVDNYVMPMIKEAPNEIAPAFIVGLLLACVPGIKELLLAYGLIALCKLALDQIKKFVNYLEHYAPNLARMLHWVVSGGEKLINAIHSLLHEMWQVVEKLAHKAWDYAKAGVQKVGQVAKDCLSSVFNWSWNKICSLFHQSTSFSYT